MMDRASRSYEPTTLVIPGTSPITLRITRYPPGYAMTRHRHCTDGVSVVLSGCLVEGAVDKEVVVGPGDTVLKPAGVNHDNRFGPHGAVLLSLTLVEGTLRDLDPRLDRWRWTANAAAAEELLRLAAVDLESVCRMLPSEEPRLEALARVAPNLCEGGLVGTAPLWVESTRTAIARTDDAHRGERMTVRHLAAKTGRHPAHLTERFRTHTGSSIRSYASWCRAADAFTRLTLSDEPLSSVAYAAGYYDQSHLCRSLRRHLGVTPTTVRMVTQHARWGIATNEPCVRTRLSGSL